MNRLLRNMPVGFATIVITILILYFTLSPDPMHGHYPLIPGFDKIAHFLMFFAFAIALNFDWLKKQIPKRTNIIRLVSVLIITMAFGGAIEVLQETMDIGRSMEFSDFISDTIGGIAAIFSWKYLFSKIAEKALKDK